jgi:translation initiation factor eIF-2B subunit beta
MKTGSSSVDSLISKLKRRTVVGSFHCAKETLLVLRNIASQSKWSNVQELLDKIKMYGAKLSNAQPIELAVGNMVRRVLHMIREEYITYVLEDPSIPAEKKPLQQTATASMIDLLGDSNSTRVDMNLVPVSVMKPLVIQEINQFIDELDSLYMNIASQALDHIHDNEVIMTLGKSKTVEEFLKAAHRKRKFQVLVAAGGPTSQGRDLVSSLARSGIDAKFIPDSDIFAYMSRVNKVILSTHAVLANGGLIASTGSHLIALSAKYHHVPLIVTAGLYKLSPLQPSDEDKFNLLDNPDVILPYHHGRF